MTDLPDRAKGIPDRPVRLWILVLITALAPFALQSLVPAMPGMARDFGTSFATSQMSLTSYLIGMAIGQLVWGPLSDRFGRRPVLLAGLGVFLSGSAFCLMAWDMAPLIAGRGLQALGGSAGMVLARAIIRDRYERAHAAQMIAYVTAGMIAAPMLGPVVGGHLYEWSGWQAVFWFVLAFGLAVTAACYRFLGETRHATRHSVSLTQLWRGCGSLLRQRRFRGYSLQVTFTSGTFFSFLGGASAVTVDIYGQTASDYGWWFILVAACYMLGNFMSARIGPRVHLDLMITVGTVTTLLAAAAMLTVALLDGLTLARFFLLSGVMSVGNGFSMPNGYAGVVSVNPALSGTASGLSGALQMGLGAILMTVVGHTLTTSPMPVILLMLAGAMLALLSHLHGLRQ